MEVNWELKLAACSDISSLAALLADSVSADVPAVLAHVPECLPGDELAQLLFSDTTTISEQVARACVSRAESIDMWTGRLDWSISWLQALPPQAQSNPLIQRCLCNALILSNILCVTKTVPWSLAQINTMEEADWLCNLLEMANSITTEVASFYTQVFQEIQINEKLQSEWNHWWLQRLADHDDERLALAIANCGRWFYDSTLLLAIYQIGGMCSQGTEDTRAALLSIAANHQIEEIQPADSVELPQAVADALQEDCQWCGQTHQLAEDTVQLVVAAGLAQIHAIDLLNANTSAHIDMPGILQCKGNAQAQTQLLAKILRDPRLELRSLLLDLRAMKVLDFVDRLVIDAELLSALLRTEQFDQARLLMQMPDAEAFQQHARVRDTVCAAARELFDNAESGDRERGQMHAATQCLNMLSEEWQQDASVQRERLLIDTAHLVHSLGSPTGTLRLFHTGETRVQPIEIRLASDPFDFVQLVLSRYPEGYARQRLIREIAANMICLLCDSCQVQMSLRDLAVRSIEEAHVVGLLLEAALQAGDLAACQGFVRQLNAARTVFASSMDVVERQRALRLLENQPAKLSEQERAIDLIWNACIDLAQQLSSKGSDESEEAVSLALSLCPTNEMPRLLQLLAASKPSLEDVGGDVLQHVQEILLGSGGAESADAAATAGDKDQPGDDDVDIEAIRTFDPAIIRRCLRVAGDAAGHRRNLLLEWLDFALTTAKEPRDARAQAFRESLEKDIAKRMAPEALECLHKRVWPQLDKTNLTQIHGYFDMQMRLAAAAEDFEAEKRSRARCRLALRLQQDPQLREVQFDLLEQSLCKSEACEQCVCALATDLGVDAGLLIPLADDLAAVAGDHMTASELTSNLLAWQLHKRLDVAIESKDATAFLDLLAAESEGRLGAKEAAKLADRLAFDSSAAQALDIGERLSALVLCPEDRQGTVERARDYVQFLEQLRSMHDPFTFVPLSNKWVSGFDVGRDNLHEQWLGTLVRMCLAEPAYFVCQACVWASDLLERFGQQKKIHLDEVYGAALDQAVCGDDEAVLMRVCESPLELGQFNYGQDSTLGIQLLQFKKQFKQKLNDKVADPHISSAMRLCLLDVLGRHYDEQDSNTRMRLWADQHWGVQAGELEQLEQRVALWQQLLSKTERSEQVVQLADELLRWPEEADACWVQLLQWAVESQSYVRETLASAMDNDRGIGALERVGSQVFDKLIPEARRRGELVCPLAELALLYPQASWVEPVVELVVYALSQASNLPQDIQSTGGDVEDAWDIDDDDILSDEGEDQMKNADLAYKNILTNSWVHLGLAFHKLISLALPYPQLLSSIKNTLFDYSCMSELPPADRSILCYHIQSNGVSGILEVLCRCVHLLRDFGLYREAILWIYEALNVPLQYRYDVREGKVAEMWIKQLDCLCLSKHKEKSEDYVVKDDSNPLQLQREKQVASSLSGSLQLRDEEQAANAWGADMDIDLYDKEDHLASNQTVPEINQNADAVLQDNASVPSTVAATKAPETVLATSDGVIEDNDHAWGDVDDIDLDADLENL
ncbi:hypothetical protein IWW36_001737 [Coemansia brasiliensis]|uniref:Sec39 domain-containing protein n=1 Tax=Coemansia brasiliensis TaxID=2650707 RepID=A0A9W8IDA9_9FUNG|nr:hypothetical protein IWW36_001737 [Coemansia brasiliensis]